MNIEAMKKVLNQRVLLKRPMMGDIVQTTFTEISPSGKFANASGALDAQSHSLGWIGIDQIEIVEVLGPTVPFGSK